jgi:hypothetical protein
MIDKSSLAGWVVQLVVPPSIALPRADSTKWVGAAMDGAPSFQYFNVAIVDNSDAVEATRKYCGASKDAVMTSVRALSALEAASISLLSGEVKPA